MAVVKPLVLQSGEMRQFSGASDILAGSGKGAFVFGNKRSSGLATGVLPFVAIASYDGTIFGWWIRHDATSITVKFLKRASDAEPSLGDSINTSGLSVSTGITKSTTLTDFTTLAVAEDDVVVPYITSITGTLLSFECALILTKN